MPPRRRPPRQQYVRTEDSDLANFLRSRGESIPQVLAQRLQPDHGRQPASAQVYGGRALDQPPVNPMHRRNQVS